MNIRKLWFRNAQGKKFLLDGTDGVYASSLAGLGFDMAPDMGDLGGGFFALLDNDCEPQRNITFSITFTRNPYSVYQQFIDFLAVGNISLVYVPVGSAQYIRDVSVTSVSKGELNTVGWLDCSCSILCLTPWYLPSATVLALESDGSADTRRYPYTYTPGLRYGSESVAALSGVIAPTGQIPGALEIMYTGGITNPRISLIGQRTGKLYGLCDLKAEIPADACLMFSSRRNGSFVIMVSPDLTATDLLGALDLSHDPYPRIPVDESCVLRIDADSEITGTATVQVYYYFRSV